MCPPWSRRVKEKRRLQCGGQGGGAGVGVGGHTGRLLHSLDNEAFWLELKAGSCIWGPIWVLPVLGVDRGGCS